MHLTFLFFFALASVHSLPNIPADTDPQPSSALGKPRVKHVLHMMVPPPYHDPLISKQCTLPKHAQQIGNPCAFACLDPYLERNGNCACVFPYTECNGVCGIFHGGCSAGAVSRRRKHRRAPITTLVQAKHTCKINESVCGIPGREHTLDFECVDTTSSLDNCGGCATPHPFEEAYRSTVIGVECARLQGVVVAACAQSRCVVSRCVEGMSPGDDAAGCVPDAGRAGGYYQVALRGD